MSPSRSPTFAPVCASAIARFAATVLFPTPPFPEPTAITCPTPSSAFRSAEGSFGFRTRLRPGGGPPPRPPRAPAPPPLGPLPPRGGPLGLPPAARGGDAPAGPPRVPRGAPPHD